MRLYIYHFRLYLHISFLISEFSFQHFLPQFQFLVDDNRVNFRPISFKDMITLFNVPSSFKLKLFIRLDPPTKQDKDIDLVKPQQDITNLMRSYKKEHSNA